MDLDSASEDGELDEQEHEAHSVEGSSSFRAWQLPLSYNLQDLELQSNADTCTEKSFNLVYQVVDNEDTASMSSFQMIPTTASSVADPDEQQEQQQQQDQEQQQSSVHELHQLEQEPDVADGGDEASNVADVGSNVAGSILKGIVQANELAKWREDQLPDASFQLLDVDQIYLTHHNGGASITNAQKIGPHAKKKMIDGKEVIKLCEDGLHRVVWEVPMAGDDCEWQCL